jgi:hypothetical protein
MSLSIQAGAQRYEIRFQPVIVHGRTLAFPCDENGCVDLDTLGDRARNNYFYGRVAVGREYRAPTVVSVEEADAVDA